MKKVAKRVKAIVNNFSKCILPHVNIAIDILLREVINIPASIDIVPTEPIDLAPKKVDTVLSRKWK
jgi:hypothetical protein